MSNLECGKEIRVVIDASDKVSLRVPEEIDPFTVLQLCWKLVDAARAKADEVTMQICQTLTVL